MKELKDVKILVVEDDDGVLSFLKTFFEKEGAVVEEERDGRHVLTRVESFRPDIILLDIIMPYEDGLTLLVRLRQNGDHTPVIMLTEKISVEDTIEGLDSGADDYIAKPFSTGELLSRVKSVLRRVLIENASKENETLGLGNVRINFSSREVFVNDLLVRLTKTEFELLWHLVRERGRVVSYADLLGDVLGYKEQTETKALVMHIANIRKKMVAAGAVGGKIETVTGVGYMFREG